MYLSFAKIDARSKICQANWKAHAKQDEELQADFTEQAKYQNSFKIIILTLYSWSNSNNTYLDGDLDLMVETV